MRRLHKIFGLILTLIFAISLFIYSPVTANASYTYRIKLMLGNNEYAYFDEEVVDTLKNSYSVEYPVIRKTDGKSLTNQLIISGLEYGDTVSLNVASLIKIDNDNVDVGKTKYYVKGLRVSGDDDVLQMDSLKNITFTVTGDESYVVAYGVGATIPYTVRYMDEEENNLLEDDVLYAAEGEIIFVPARHISGYTPDAYFKTASSGLKKYTVFTFIYSKGEPTVIYNEEVIDVETTENVDGGTEYDYEYEYVDGGTTVITHDNGTTTSTVHESVQGESTGTVNNREGAAGDTSDQNTADTTDDNGDASTNITDGNVPQSVIDIDDEDTAKAGGERDRLVRNMIIGIIIAMAAVVSILIALYVADRKRKKELVKVNESNKDNQ